MKVQKSTVVTSWGTGRDERELARSSIATLQAPLEAVLGSGEEERRAGDFLVVEKDGWVPCGLRQLTVTPESRRLAELVGCGKRWM